MTKTSPPFASPAWPSVGLALLILALAAFGPLAQPAHAGDVAAGQTGAISAAAEIDVRIQQAGLDRFPTLEISPEQVGLTIDGIRYPVQILQGHLGFTRRQARLTGNERGFYEWGEILHLYDTATERVLGARAAWDAGFRVTEADLRAFADATVNASPTYLDELYGGSPELFLWDSQLQILMKKWMAYKAHDAPLGSSWQQAGQLMKATPEEFEKWGLWYEESRRSAQVVTFPERLERQGESPPRWGVVFLAGLLVLVVSLWLRAMARAGPRSDLMQRWPQLGWALHRRIYPEGLRAVLLAGFVLVLGALALGPSTAHRNLGSVYLWILWWPLVPFLLFVSGRSWCAVCPIATVGDLIQRLPFPRVRRTPTRLVLAGVWLVDGTFILITWLDRSLGLVDSVRLTLTALLLLVGASVTAALLFERRAFCRHVCFFGAFAANYGLASLVELRPSGGSCRGCDRAACLKRAAPEACPMFERPRALSSSRNCNLCLTCLRECGRGVLALRVRDPLKEISRARHPELALALLAALLVGVVAVQNLGMLEVAGVLERRMQELTGLGRTATNSLLYMVALAAPVGLLAGAAGFDRRRMALYGYLLIPLDLGSHAAHNLLHLLGEGRAIWWVTAQLVGLPSPLDIPGGHPGGSMGAAVLDVPTIKALQVGLLLLAAWGSFVLARRAQRRFKGEVSFLPAYGLLLALLAVNLWLFSNPMALRH